MSRCRSCNCILPSLQLSQKKYLEIGDGKIVQVEYEDMCNSCISDSFQTYSIVSKEYAFEDLESGIKLPYKSNS